MWVKNTEAARKVQQAVASMAIEGMYLSEEFILKLIEAGEGKRTYEELRKEVLNMPDSKYCYHDSDVLINKMGIKDIVKLFIAEKVNTYFRIYILKYRFMYLT